MKIFSYIIAALLATASVMISRSVAAEPDVKSLNQNDFRIVVSDDESPQERVADLLAPVSKEVVNYFFDNDSLVRTAAILQQCGHRDEAARVRSHFPSIERYVEESAEIGWTTHTLAEAALSLGSARAQLMMLELGFGLSIEWLPENEKSQTCDAYVNLFQEKYSGETPP